MILNDTLTVDLTIAGTTIPAGMSPNGEIAFFSTLKLMGTIDAKVDDQQVKLVLDASRWSKAHKFIYATRLA